MEKYNFFKQRGAERPAAGQLLDTKLFYDNASLIYARFDAWKDSPRFYFIPLYMEMTYSCAGWVAEMAPDPIWLGSFVRCVLEHPELFQYRCPECGEVVYPYRCAGSPLSGRVDLEGQCDCGWKGFEMTSGWFVRGEALREQIAADTARYRKYRLLHPAAEPSAVEQLLRFLEGGQL